MDDKISIKNFGQFGYQVLKNNIIIIKDYFSKQKVRAIDTPKVVRTNDKIDYEKINELKYNNLILEFVSKIKNNIPDDNLDCLYNNINDLKVISFTYDNNKIKNINKSGGYRLYDNIIKIDDKLYKSIYHELVHLSSTYVDKKNNVTYCGFEQIIGNDIIVQAVNEGYTQLVTERYFDEIKENDLYPYLKTIAEALEYIVGTERMQPLLFKHDLKGLIKILSEYNYEDDFYKFVNDLDFLNAHLSDIYIMKYCQNLICYTLERVNKYLIQTYTGKLIFDNNINDSNELNYYVSNYVQMLPAFASIGNKKIDILSDKLKTNSINEVISDCFDCPKTKRR